MDEETFSRINCAFHVREVLQLSWALCGVHSKGLIAVCGSVFVLCSVANVLSLCPTLSTTLEPWKPWNLQLALLSIWGAPRWASGSCSWQLPIGHSLTCQIADHLGFCRLQHARVWQTVSWVSYRIPRCPGGLTAAPTPLWARQSAHSAILLLIILLIGRRHAGSAEPLNSTAWQRPLADRSQNLALSIPVLNSGCPAMFSVFFFFSKHLSSWKKENKKKE